MFLWIKWNSSYFTICNESIFFMLAQRQYLIQQFFICEIKIIINTPKIQQLLAFAATSICNLLHQIYLNKLELMLLYQHINPFWMNNNSSNNLVRSRRWKQYSDLRNNTIVIIFITFFCVIMDFLVLQFGRCNNKNFCDN